MTAPQTRLMLADELENLRMLDARAGYAFKCADNIETIIAALRATEPAHTPPATGLREALAEYARDLRRNSSGGDDYPWETMRGVADYLDVLMQRHPAQSSMEGRREEIAREALEFYADPTRYNGPNIRLEGEPDRYQPDNLYYRLDVTRDGGGIARNALTHPRPVLPVSENEGESQ